MEIRFSNTYARRSGARISGINHGIPSVIAHRVSKVLDYEGNFNRLRINSQSPGDNSPTFMIRAKTPYTARCTLYAPFPSIVQFQIGGGEVGRLRPLVPGETFEPAINNRSLRPIEVERCK